MSIRLEKLLNKFAELKCDAYLSVGKENVRWLSGFTGAESAVFVTANAAVFITDFRYIEQAEAECGGFEFVMTKAKYGLNNAVKDLCAKYGVKALAVEAGRMTLSEYESMRKVLNENIQIVSTEGVVEALRRTKTLEEIQMIRHSAGIAEKAFNAVLPMIVPGAVEADLANELEYQMRRFGADCPSFSTIFISGTKTSLPHGIPSEKRIERGDLVTIDFGAKWHGYCSDITRTVGVCELSDEQKELYNLVLQAQLECESMIAPGVACSAPHLKAVELFGDLSKYFGHGLGHGVGLEIHESPRLNAVSPDTLQVGDIVSCEPGLYINGKYGVRIEDTVAVTPDGYSVLNGISKALTIVG